MQDLSVVPEASQTPVWINGKIVDWKNAYIHIFSHVISYGSGVFEGVRVYETPKGTAIFHLTDHLDRLDLSAKSFGMKLPYSRHEFVEAHKEVVRASGHAHGYLRPQIQFGVSSRITLAATDATDVTIIFQPLGQYRATKELKVVTSEVERISPKSGDVEAKIAGYYTNPHYNHLFANKKGADEAIMLDINGNVAEASSSNVFYVKDGELYTPKTGYILKGITRKTLLELAEKELGMKTHEVVMSPEDLRSGDEIFLSGTAAEIDPVVEIDGTQISNGKIGDVTQKLTDLYGKVTSGTLPGYEQWLTYVN